MASSCAPSSQNVSLEPALSDAAGLTSQKKAVVILSGVVKFQAMWTTYPSLTTSWLTKDHKGQFGIGEGLRVSEFGKPGKPAIKQIKAGRYTLQTFSFHAHNLKYANTAGLRGAPITGFTVKPGEVVYLGHMVVHPEKSILVKSKMKQKIKIHDHAAAALAHLRAKSPELAGRMTTRLLKISPLFALSGL